MIKSTKFIGKLWHHFDVVDSTNTEALRIIQTFSENSSTKSLHGTLLTSFNQIQGVGQRGNSWLCPPEKNLAYSLILQNVPLAPAEYFLLNMTAALAVHGCLRREIANSRPALEVQLKIKWPNDIFFGNQKISGMLLHNTAKGNVIENTIVGIGINVNQTDFDVLPDAVSLITITHAETELWWLIEKLSLSFEKYYQLLVHSPETIKKQYLDHLFKLGEPAIYKRRADNQFFEGTIQGVTDEGKLTIKTRHGLEFFVMQEISFVNTNNY